MKLTLSIGIMLLSPAYVVAMDSTALIKMINDGKYADVKEFVEKSQEFQLQQMINTPDQNGDIPLFAALGVIGEAREILVEALLEAGANAALIKNGITPLMLACANASLGTIKLLCNKGALQTITHIHEGQTALNWACKAQFWNPYLRVSYLISQCPSLPFLTEIDFTRLVVFQNYSTIELLLNARKDWAPETIRAGLECAHKKYAFESKRLFSQALYLKGKI